MKMKLRDVGMYDGEYEIGTPDDWTNKEWSTIKRISGALPLTIEQAIDEGDVEVFVALAIIGLQRAGKGRVNEELLWSSTLSMFDIAGDEDAGADPQTLSEPDMPMKPSGSPSLTDSGNLEVLQPDSGIPTSDTSDSDRRISAT